MSELIAGVDEVGRGPLVGPVVAAAVILDPEHPIEGLMDSKKLSEKRREALAAEIREKSKAYSLGQASPSEIDSINILQASLLAMQRAVFGLGTQPEEILVDGNHAPKFDVPTQAIIKGDDLIAAISAASILAKVARDAMMVELDQHYPDYGFAKHKGYPTKAHLQAIGNFGIISGQYRESFGPVKRLLGRQVESSIA